MKLTKTIKKRMVDRDMNQKELAELIGLTESALSRRFSGKTEWKRDELREVCRALGMKKGDVL